MENKFNPDYALHVGKFLKRALDAYGMKQNELAEKICVSKSIINEIINGKRNMNPTIAIKLEGVFNMPASYWLGLQSDFEIAIQRGGTVIEDSNENEITIGKNNALDVAYWFINKASQNVNDECDYITHLKLQKLLYYAQALSLKNNNKTIFCDAMQCWEYGPVVNSVYQKYKEYKKEPIKTAPFVKFDKETEKILELTYSKYGIYTANYLVKLTHIEKVWKDAEPNEILSPLIIKQTFSDLV